MHKTESATCFTNEIRKRWPRWTPSDVEASDWLVWLEKYDYANIAEAARAHLAESRYAKPMPHQLLERARTLRLNRCRAQTGSAHSRKNDTGFPEAHTFILCIDKDDRGRGKVGWFVDIILWPFKTHWTEADYQRVATEQAAKYADFYGGVWQVFTHTTQLEMLRCAATLRGTQPLDLDDLRNRYPKKAAAVRGKQKPGTEVTRWETM